MCLVEVAAYQEDVVLILVMNPVKIGGGSVVSAVRVFKEKGYRIRKDLENIVFLQC